MTPFLAHTSQPLSSFLQGLGSNTREGSQTCSYARGHDNPFVEFVIITVRRTLCLTCGPRAFQAHAFFFMNMF